MMELSCHGALFFLRIGLVLLECFTNCENNKEFIFNFMESDIYDSVEPIGLVYTINPGNATVHVKLQTPLITSGSAMVNESFAILPGNTHLSFIPSDTLLKGLAKEDKGIYLVSDGEVIVQAHNAGNKLADSFLVPSTIELGTHYVTVTYKFLLSSQNQKPFTIGVSAMEGATRVCLAFTGMMDISFQLEGKVINRGDNITVVLNKFETFQLQVAWNEGDITGTSIISDKPIFVQSGSVGQSVKGAGGWDHLAEVLPPIQCMGTVYFISPFAERTTGDTIRIIASDVDADIVIKDHVDSITWSGTVQAYNHFDIETSSTKFYSINSTSAIMVAQFMESASGERHSNTDPMMIILKPTTQWQPDYTFITVSKRDGSNYLYNHINIVIESAHLDSLEYDGAPFSATWETIGSSYFSGTRFPITPGQHNVRSLTGQVFQVVLYGQSSLESYGNVAGYNPNLKARCYSRERSLPTAAHAALTTNLKPELEEATVTAEQTPQIGSQGETTNNPSPTIAQVTVRPQPETTTWNSDGNSPLSIDPATRTAVDFVKPYRSLPFEICFTAIKSKPTGNGGIMHDESQVKGGYPLKECFYRCMGQKKCVSFYVHPGNFSCVTHGTKEPAWILSDDLWEFYVINGK